MIDDKVRTTLRIESDAINKIKYIAKINKRSFNSQVEYFLEQCIKDFEKQNGVIPLQEEN